MERKIRWMSCIFGTVNELRKKHRICCEWATFRWVSYLQQKRLSCRCYASIRVRTKLRNPKEWRGRDIRVIVKIATIGWFVCMSGQICYGRSIAKIKKKKMNGKGDRIVGLSVCHANACRLCQLVDRSGKRDERWCRQAWRELGGEYACFDTENRRLEWHKIKRRCV